MDFLLGLFESSVGGSRQSGLTRKENGAEPLL
jgi:hypothetical protein